MKMDRNLLLGIGAAIAFAFAVAAYANVLPPFPKIFNPLQNWSAGKCAAAFGLTLAAVVLGMWAITKSDGTIHSATLEWVYSSKTAAEVVAGYGDQRDVAVRGVVLDSVLFIPSYMLFIAVMSFWVGHGWKTEPLASWTIAAGWLVAWAAAFDYIENAGMYAALGGFTFRLAPLTYAACQIKWVLASISFWFALFAGLARAVGIVRTS